MRAIVSRDDFVVLGELLKTKEAERRQTAKGLGSAAEHGGATLSKIPEFSSLLDNLRVHDEIVRYVSDLLGTAVVVSLGDLDPEVVTAYTEVVVKHVGNGELEKYYLIEDVLTKVKHFPQDLCVVSPKSAMGLALSGKKVGDQVVVEIPSMKSLKLMIISMKKVAY